MILQSIALVLVLSMWVFIGIWTWRWHLRRYRSGMVSRELAKYGLGAGLLWAFGIYVIGTGLWAAMSQ